MEKHHFKQVNQLQMAIFNSKLFVYQRVYIYINNQQTCIYKSPIIWLILLKSHVQINSSKSPRSILDPRKKWGCPKNWRGCPRKRWVDDPGFCGLIWDHSQWCSLFTGDGDFQRRAGKAISHGMGVGPQQVSTSLNTGNRGNQIGQA